jgi:uncharacterized LabA/DUF88 family protein
MSSKEKIAGFQPAPPIRLSTEDITYLFVDGGYLRQKYAENMRRVFGDHGELDFQTVHNWFYGRVQSAIPRRVFYYDCIHDIKLSGESPDEFEKRVSLQKLEFEHIQSLEGFHVRPGKLTGSVRNIRQKGVDVLLAVDMLDNAFRKNMDAVLLLAGDADFVPLVEAVTRLGTWVEVYYDPKGVAKELHYAADKGVPLSFDDFWSWGTQKFRESHPIPRSERNVTFEVRALGPTSTREGKDSEGTAVSIGTRIDTKEFFIYVHEPGNVMLFNHSDEGILKKYYEELFGPITWK